MVPDLRDRGAAARWPVYASAVEELEVRSVFAFPLTAGDAAVGSLELYRTAPGELTVAQHTTAAMIGPALVAEFAVARPSGENIEPEHGLTAKFSRAEVYSAIGMLAARLRIPIDDATMRRCGGSAACARVRRAQAQAHHRRCSRTHAVHSRPGTLRGVITRKVAIVTCRSRQPGSSPSSPGAVFRCGR
jgi:hypothetical protein